MWFGLRASGAVESSGTKGSCMPAKHLSSWRPPYGFSLWFLCPGWLGLPHSMAAEGSRVSVSAHKEEAAPFFVT